MSELVRCYRNLQRARHSPEILEKTTDRGRITITLREFLLYGDIFDQLSLEVYVVFIRRDPSAAEFRNLVDLGWDRNCRHSNRNLSFTLTAAAACLQQLNPLELVQHTPAAKVPSAVTPDLEIEDDIILPVDSPRLKRSRISKKKVYSPATLAKYSKTTESKLITLLETKIPSANKDLHSQVIKDVMARLEVRFCDGRAVCNVNEEIVSNIKSLVKAVDKFGLNDREQIRFKEILALAISGSIFLEKFTDATSLSRRILENGREMRAAFNIETAKAEAEGGDFNDESDFNDDDNSEAVTEIDSNNDHEVDDNIGNDDINDDSENGGIDCLDDIPQRKKEPLMVRFKLVKTDTVVTSHLGQEK